MSVCLVYVYSKKRLPLPPTLPPQLRTFLLQAPLVPATPSTPPLPPAATAAPVIQQTPPKAAPPAVAPSFIQTPPLTSPGIQTPLDASRRPSHHKEYIAQGLSDSDEVNFIYDSF